MDSSRKRKRMLRPSYAAKHLFSVRSFVSSFSFFGFLYFVSSYIRLFNPSAFRPVLLVSSLGSSGSNLAKRIQEFDDFFTVPWKIENRVLFPDHVLLHVSSLQKDGFIKKSAKELECVYREGDKGILVKKNVLSVDEYDEFRSIVRCPVNPVNYSSTVNLRRRGKNGVLEEDRGLILMNNNQTVNSWENVVYAATLDGASVVVFVKGLNLRANRASNPAQFSCHFGLGHPEIDGRFMLRTKALTAAQEVVRCSLPRRMQINPDKTLGVRVTVGFSRYNRAGPHDRVLIPSVAKVSGFTSVERRKKQGEGKYELCMCTMVWNQATALREWITYHASLGVERWFVYDNNSDDNIDDVIKELDLENYNVTRHVWPWIKTQEAGFSHCVLRAKDECNWVAFMDVDEFFYFPYSRNGRFRKLSYLGEKSLSTLVANLSTSSRSIAEIRTSCHSFGPSGLNSRPKRGVTVGYTCRLQSPERHKSIVRLDTLDTTLLNVVHHFHLRKGFKYMNLPQSMVVINHYKYQVWEVFRAKFYRRVATYVADWKQNQNEGSRDRAPGLGTEAIEPPDWAVKFCEVRDTGLRDFVSMNLVDGSTGLLPWERASSLGI